MCLVFLTACGRKGDPEYQANGTKIVTNNF